MRHIEDTYEQPVPCPECDEETPHVVREGVDNEWIEFTEGECQRCGYTGAVCTGTRDRMAPPEAV